MRNWLVIFCIMAVMSSFCFGCSWTTQETSKDTMFRCPKCGAFFSSKEGAATFKEMEAEPGVTRR
jgi:DNA-directed RNA polymerase subunit RPC12/RpoP